MPEQPVFSGEKGFNEFFGAFPAIIFDIKDRPVFFECVGGAGENFVFHTLDVNLDEMAGLEIKIVDGFERDRLALFIAAQRYTAVIAANLVVNSRDNDIAVFGADGGVMGDDVLQGSVRSSV